MFPECLHFTKLGPLHDMEVMKQMTAGSPFQLPGVTSESTVSKLWVLNNVQNMSASNVFLASFISTFLGSETDIRFLQLYIVIWAHVSQLEKVTDVLKVHST